eukprot:gene2240-1400_t
MRSDTLRVGVGSTRPTDMLRDKMLLLLLRTVMLGASIAFIIIIIIRFGGRWIVWSTYPSSSARVGAYMTHVYASNTIPRSW